MSPLVISPKEFDPKKVSLVRFDFEESQKTFEEDASKWLVIAPVRYDRRVFRIGLKAELTTDGINVANFESKVHTIGVTFTDMRDKILLEKMYDLEVATLYPYNDRFEELTNVKNQNVLYLKLKQRNGKYKTTCDVPLDPANPQNSGLYRNQPVDLELEIQYYFNFKDKKAGIYFDLTSIKTKTDEPVKRRRKD